MNFAPSCPPVVPKITSEMVLEWIAYEPISGALTWKKTGRPYAACRPLRVKGQSAVRVKYDYHVLCLMPAGSIVMAHRAAWFLQFGEWPILLIDHINHDSFDNRLSNLRLATNAENCRNRGRMSSRNRSGFHGVCKASRYDAWIAKIRIDGAAMHIGSFRSAEEAAHAYDEAARRHSGEFASLNFPGPGERGCRQTSLQSSNAAVLQDNGCKLADRSESILHVPLRDDSQKSRRAWHEQPSQMAE